MAVTMTLYKTLYGNNPVYIFSGVESGKAADKVNDAIKAMADACEDLEEGVTGPTGATGATGAAGVGISSATIDDSGHLVLTKTDSTTTDAGYVKGPQGPAGASSFTASTDATATPSLTVADGASLQCTSSALTSVTVTEPSSGWTFGKYSHLYFVSSATAPTFACPATWCCKGDDCSDGDFEPAASTTYDLFIFRTVDTTVVSVMART